MKRYYRTPSAALGALFMLASAQAAIYTYTGNSTVAAPGNTWSSGTGWNAIPVSASDTSLVFGTATSLASGVNVNTSQDFGSPFLLNSLTLAYSGPASGTQPNVQINTGELRFVSSGATTPTISLNATGTSSARWPHLIFSNAVTFDADTTISAVSDVRFDGVLANANNAVVTKSGAGTMRLASDNPSYTGNFTISGGTFQLGNNGNSGDAGSGTINLSGGNLTVRRGGSLALNNTITGSGNVTIQYKNVNVVGGGNTITVNKANTYTGTTAFSPVAANDTANLRLGINDGLGTTSVLTVNNNGTSVLTFNLNGFNQTLGGLTTAANGSATNSKVALGAGTLTVNDAGNRTFAGQISGTGNVVKQGAGSWTLGSVNTYTGTTTISSGTLVLGAAGSINTSSLITVGGGATLTNNNTSALTAALALNEGAFLSGTGAFSPSSLSVVADLGNGYSPISAGSSLTKAGNLTFNLSGLTGITSEVTYSLFSGTPLGGFTGVSIGATALDSTDSNATFTGTVGDFTYLFKNSLNALTITPIPEPAAAAALVGCAFMGMAAVRRRRRA